MSGLAAPLRIAIVAAEPSGDLLAAGLMSALKHRLPEVVFEGVAGPRMQRQGIDCWAPMDALSVMGIFEVLRHLPRLLRLRASLSKRWLDTPPAVFIGVDAPDFNLTLEARLRDQGVPTVHYVSPTVWAWRSGRVRQLRRSVDLLLTIFPFETAFLARHGISAHYVGHPLALEMPMEPDRAAARKTLGLRLDRPVLALLPGSRRSEVGRLARPFLQAAAALRQRLPELQVVVPLVTELTEALFEERLRRLTPSLDAVLARNASRLALAAADLAGQDPLGRVQAAVEESQAIHPCSESDVVLVEDRGPLHRRAMQLLAHDAVADLGIHRIGFGDCNATGFSYPPPLF